VKAALYTVFEQLNTYNTNIPVMLSISLQENGNMLLGSNIDAIIALAERYPLVSLGFKLFCRP